MTKWAIEEKGGRGTFGDSTIPFPFTCVPCEEMRVQLCGGKASQHGSASQEHICARKWLRLSSGGSLGTHNAFGHVKCSTRIKIRLTDT